MMNAIQVTARKPQIYVRNTSQLRRFPSKPNALPLNWDPLAGASLSLRAKPSPGLLCVPILKSQKPLHVCFAGGQGMMDKNNEDVPWKAFEKDGQSIEDLFRQQLQKGDNGGNGAKPPHGGGGGGGGPGGSEDGRLSGMSNETLQVVLATIGFIFLYIFSINGAELARLFRDCINFLITGRQSTRLKRATYKWVRFFKNMTEKKEVCEHQSENASTWSDLGHCRNFIRKYLKPNASE